MSHSNKSIPLGICRWCLKPDHPSGTMCPEHPDLMVPPKNVIEAEDYESAAPAGELQIVDYATGVQGTYCIGRKSGAFMEYWNPTGWAGSGYVFTDKRIAEVVCKGVAGDAVPLTPEPDLKRWTFFYRSEHLPEGMSPRPDGQWIKYEDFLAVTAHKEAEIAQLTKDRDNWKTGAQNLEAEVAKMLEEKYAREAEVERLRKELAPISVVGIQRNQQNSQKNGSVNQSSAANRSAEEGKLDGLRRSRTQEGGK